MSYDIEQKVITVRKGDSEYYNFFFTPGSYKSLEHYVREGWIVKHIDDNGCVSCILIERKKKPENKK